MVRTICFNTSPAIFLEGLTTFLKNDSPRPCAVFGSSPPGIKDKIVKLTAGDKVSFALCESGRVYAWGKKSTGCIPEDYVRPTKIPVAFFGGEKVVDISACDSRALAITDPTIQIMEED